MQRKARAEGNALNIKTIKTTIYNKPLSLFQKTPHQSNFSNHKKQLYHNVYQILREKVKLDEDQLITASWPQEIKL